MRLLFLINPDCIHDEKKILFFINQGHRVFFISTHHLNIGNTRKKVQFICDSGGVYLGNIDSFSAKKAWKTLKTAIHIKKLISVHKIEVFVIIYAEPNALWSVFKKLLSVKITIFTYGSDVLLTIPAFSQKGSLNLFAKLVYYLYNKSFSNADLILSTSRKQKESVKRIVKKTTNCEIVRTGVDINFEFNAKPPSFDREFEKLIFFPRMMTPLYKHEFSLEAINLLPQNIKNRNLFIFINTTAPENKYFQSIQSKAQKIHDKNIIFLPELTQNEIFGIYKLSSLVVMNPSSDGSPVSAMEAMAFKKPVILPPLPYDEDIFNSKTVTFFDKWTPTSLAFCIERLLKPDDELLEKIQNGHDVIHKLCSYKKEMNRFEQLLMKISS